MDLRIKEYAAIIWRKNSGDAGVHETIYAYSYEEAEAILEKKFGKEIIVSLTDVEAESRPRK